MTRKRLKVGAARMAQLGKKPIQLWVTDAEWEELRNAAVEVGQNVAQFVRFNALKTAMAVNELRRTDRGEKKAAAPGGKKPQRRKPSKAAAS